MLLTSFIILALTALAAAKPPSNSRTYAVNYFYGTGPLTEGRLDPIISPGKNPSNHVHTFMGGAGLEATMGDDAGLNAACTNSKPKADNSNYWWPKLYFHDPNNGSFIDVDLYYAKVYYFSEPTDDETMTIPRGTQLLAGNAMRRSLNDQGGSLNIDSGKGTINPVQFVCGTSKPNPWPVNSDGTGGVGVADPHVGGHGVGFPDANCDGYTTPLRYDLHFPSCINPAAPRNSAFTNSAYPSSTGAKNGQNCPSGWIHIPHIFIEVYWNTPPFASLWTPGQGKQPFVLAQGDPTGYGLHGDFVAGWDEAELQALIDGCDAGDAGFDKCPNIDAEGGVNPSSNECHIPPPSTEVIHGVLDALPGCNPLQWGPGEATVQTTNCGGALTNPNTTTPSASSNASSIAPVPTIASSSASASNVASSSSTSTSAMVSAVGGVSSSSMGTSTSTSAVVSAVGGASSSSSLSASSSTTSTMVAPASSSTSSSPAEVAPSSSSSSSSSQQEPAFSSPTTSSAARATTSGGSFAETSGGCSAKKATKTVVHKTTVTVTATPQAELRRRRVHAHANPHRHALRQEDSL